ncbi:MAG: hypothetical protein WCF65_02860 [Parachlamydiaceae bacterium]
MHRNFLWQAFLGIVALATLWYSCIAAYRYYSYSRLDGHAETSTISWIIEEHATDTFTLKANYQFTANQAVHHGTTRYPDDNYLNQWAAEQAAKSNTKHPWTVWYDQSHPDTSSLQKNFPFKECLSAIILWGLLLYFLWLGFYVSRYKS